MRPEGSPVLAADLAALSIRGGRLEILLVRRRHDPFAGRHAVPGGFVEPDEDAAQGARREFREETGLEAGEIHLVGVYSAPGRDPRGRVASAVYLAGLAPDAPDGTAGDDAAEAHWFPLADPPSLAFDHDQVLADLRRDLRRRVETAAFGLRLAPPRFTLGDLARTHAVLLGRGVDPDRLGQVFGADRLLVEAGWGQYQVDEAALREVESRGYVGPGLPRRVPG